MKPYIVHRSRTASHMVSVRPPMGYDVPTPIGFVELTSDGKYAARKLGTTTPRTSGFPTKDAAAKWLYTNRNIEGN
jgi:hypothetical protein